VTDEWQWRLEQLVDRLVTGGLVQSPRVARALRRVPRHLFLPGVDLATVYRNRPVPHVWERDRLVSTSSQPGMMALMAERLGVSPGDRVLEVGTGTGYNAAFLAELVTPGGTVVSLEVDEACLQHAQAALTRAGYPRVDVVGADGGFGWLPCAPYDRVCVTATATALPAAWLRQLRPGGTLTTPLQVHGLPLVITFERTGDVLRSRSVDAGVFVPLRGAFARGEPGLQAGRCTLRGQGVGPQDAEAVRNLLATVPQALPLSWHGRRPWWQLVLYLATTAPRGVTLHGYEGRNEVLGGGVFDPAGPSLCAAVHVEGRTDPWLWCYGPRSPVDEVLARVRALHRSPHAMAEVDAAAQVSGAEASTAGAGGPEPPLQMTINWRGLPRP
jgi:methyltransferase of FxLD system